MSAQSLPLIKNYIDRELLQQVAATCDLWVSVAANRVSFLVADKMNNRVVGLSILEMADNSIFQKGLFELKSWFGGIELFAKEYNNTHIVFETPQFAIVPEALFAPEKADVLLAALHELPKFYAVKNNRIENKQCVNVYAVPDIFYSTIKVLFPQASFNHYATNVLKANLVMNEKQPHTLFVNMHANYMDVMHLHQQELRFFNTFIFEADTDIVYFILSVAEQQKLSIDKLHLQLTGDINANGALLQLLRKYVPNVSLFKRAESFAYPASFREFQDQQYFTTTSVLLCE